MHSGIPLIGVIPNLSELLANPRETLARQEIRIPTTSRLTVGLWLLLIGFLGLSFLLAGFRSELLFFMVLSFFGCGVYLSALGWWYGRPEIVLQEKGVLFEGGRYRVFCPWALFTSAGTPFMRQGLTKMVVLPIAAEAVPLIEIWRDGHPLGHDSLRKARDLIRLSRPDTITLSGSYPDEVGALLLQLGPALAQPVTPQAIHQAPVEAPTTANRSGDWVTINLTQLTFPPVCCRCTTPTEATRTWDLSPRWDWLRTIITHMHQNLQVALPVCGPCSAADRRRFWNCILIGALVGTGLTVWLAVLTGSFLVVLGGAILGLLFGEHPPVSVANYSLHKQSVSLRFRNRAYTDLYLEHLESVREMR